MRITDLRNYLERNFKGTQAFDTENIVVPELIEL